MTLAAAAASDRCPIRRCSPKRGACSAPRCTSTPTRRPRSRAKAKQQLAEAGFDFVEIPLPNAIRSRAIGAIAGMTTVPQVFVNGRLIGGSAELDAWLRKAA